MKFKAVNVSSILLMTILFAFIASSAFSQTTPNPETTVAVVNDVPITEADLGNATLPDGSVVYTFERVTVGGRSDRRSLEIDTLCTRGLMLASKEKLDKDLRSQLSSLMLKSAAKIIGSDE